ncbi:bifunctional Proteasome beta-type subunit [Babesia duncani]|uniref:Proteasome subunit beta n=1 Tax=Babesia duncani TaxID=323732 RepID=A0AAD9PIX0_9APIC|nr:bifunctional Proteasome beta-type subunit [Babesia duncani]
MLELMLENTRISDLGHMHESNCYSDVLTDATHYGEVRMGTTIIAMKYGDGVILAADSRTSSGPVVVNRVARKITRILPNVFMLRSGSAADTQNISAIIRYHAQALRQQLRTPVKDNSVESEDMQVDENEASPSGQVWSGNYDCSVRGPPIRSLAKVTHNIVHEYRDHLTCGIILGGFDFENGPEIYNVAIGGTLVPIKDFIAGGSGSGYITAFLKDRYRENMSLSDCLGLLKRAIEYAIECDNSSGGLMRAVCVSDGIVKEYCFTF